MLFMKQEIFTSEISKKAFFKQKFNGYKNDIKNTWHTISSTLGNKSLINCNSLKPQLLTNHFNNHFFTAVADKLLHTLPTSTSNYCDYLNSASDQSIYV